MIDNTFYEELLLVALCIFFLIVSVVFAIEIIITVRSERLLRISSECKRSENLKASDYDAIKNIITSNYSLINENIYGVYDKLKDIKGRTIEINNFVDSLKFEKLNDQNVIVLVKENSELIGIIVDLQAQLSKKTI